jgi:hypothetical protein
LQLHRSSPGAPARAASARRARLRWIDVATLVAVVAVVAVVSLPRLADFARRENQGDAARLAKRLALECEKRATPVAQPRELRSIVESLPHAARRQLDDVSFVDGRDHLLRRHGYLFELVPRTGAPNPWAVRAWPWISGRTGARAYLALSSTELYEHASPPPEWSGPEHPPELGALEPQALIAQGWTHLAREE